MDDKYVPDITTLINQIPTRFHKKIIISPVPRPSRAKTLLDAALSNERQWQQLSPYITLRGALRRFLKLTLDICPLPNTCPIFTQVNIIIFDTQ